MKQIFSVIGGVRDWIKGVITDPESRLYSSTTLVAMGIIACDQMGIHATLQNLMRVTGFSSMQIYRGTDTLRKHGLLERKDNGVWFWSVQLPNDIKDLHPEPANNTGVDELKAFITDAFSNIQINTPNGQDKIKQVVAEVQHFTPKPKREPRAKSGPRALFGDAVLDFDDGTK